MSKPTPTPPPPINLLAQATNWRAGSVPVVVDPSSLSFDFPTLPAEVGYVIGNYAGPISTTRIRMSGTITGVDPVFGSNSYTPGQGLPPNFRFVLWRLDQWSNENDRLWSNPDHVVLTDGGQDYLYFFTLEVPLFPDRWSGVLGEWATKSSFAAMLRNVAQIGVTFGSNGNFGHGVGLLSGSANFTCSEFALL